MVLFDSTTFLLLIHPNTNPPLDPITKSPITKSKERINFLVNTLEKKRTKIIIPTPVLSEILVRAGKAGNSYISIIEQSAVFEIVAFDTLAAVEVAYLTANELKDKNKKGLSPEKSRAKVKYDRQIVAIGKVSRVSVIYTDDKDLANLAKSLNISTIGVGDLPVPQENDQMDIDWEAKMSGEM